MKSYIIDKIIYVVSVTAFTVSYAIAFTDWVNLFI